MQQILFTGLHVYSVLATLLKLDLGMAENNKKAIQLYALLDQNTFKASSQAAQRRYSASSEFHELSVLHLLGKERERPVVHTDAGLL